MAPDLLLTGSDAQGAVRARVGYDRTVRTVRYDLGGGSLLEITRDFLAASAAAELHEALVDELPWESREVVLFGRRIPQPRLIAWMGELPYRYSGQTLEPRSLAPRVALVLEQIAEATGTPFNHVLLNRYRHGHDSMGLHSDDEPELGTDPVVATLSLGAPRALVLVPRRKTGIRLRVQLEPGSLTVMSGTCQRTHRHGIPRVQGPVGERISLTLRHLLREPAA